MILDAFILLNDSLLSYRKPSLSCDIPLQYELRAMARDAAYAGPDFMIPSFSFHELDELGAAGYVTRLKSYLCNKQTCLTSRSGKIYHAY